MESLVRSGSCVLRGMLDGAVHMKLHHPETNVAQPSPRSHLVKFYDEDDHLAEVAGPFLAGGAQTGETLVVIATPEHCDRFRDSLEAFGWDTEGLEEARRLLFLDAQETLDRIMIGGDMPDPAAFRTVLAGAVGSALHQGAGRVRAFGEMVDLLWHNDQREAALRLEAMWGQFMMSHPITLLCAYHTNLLTDADHARLERVCGAHTHTVGSGRQPMLDAAVTQALADVVGPQRAAQLHPLIEASLLTNGHLSTAERIVFWLQRNLPTHLDPVLDRARARMAEAG